MENNFRPIPLTIVDLLAVLVPGFVWVLIFYGTHQLLNAPPGVEPPTPSSAVVGLVAFLKSWDPWLGSLYLLFASLSVGWIIKPIALPCAQFFSRYLISISRETRSLKPRDFHFPFTKLFHTTTAYQSVVKLLQSKLKSDPLDLPGAQPFTASRRYLRLVAPAFWEESERIEAEVRMLAALTIASIMTFVLQSTVILFHITGHFQSVNISQRLLWMLAFLFLSVLLAHSFNRLRMREVAYAYHNVIIASRLLPDATPSPKTARA